MVKRSNYAGEENKVISKRTRVTPSLPKEIIDEIIMKLPVKPFCRFRCVSKSWQKFLTDDKFVRMYLGDNVHGFVVGSEDYHSISCGNEGVVSHRLELPTSISRDSMLIGSANGLLCFSCYPYYGSRFHLWNPCTGEYKSLPPAQMRNDIFDNMILGFGFDHTINDYKLVRMISYTRDMLNQVDVYNLRTNSWQKAGYAPHSRTVSGWSTVAVNGAIYWLIQPKMAQISDSILSFDMYWDKFEVLPLPDREGASRVDLLSYKGCVSVSCWTPDLKIDIWVNHEYGLRSWTKQFTISLLPPLLQPGIRSLIAICEHGEIVMENLNSNLVLYNLESGEVKQVAAYPYIWTAYPYSRTLVSLASPRSQCSLGSMAKRKATTKVILDQDNIFFW